MAKKCVTAAELQAEIQRRLLVADVYDGDCKKCRAPMPERVLEPEKNDGVNWQVRWVDATGVCRECIEMVVQPMVHEYELTT
jgi:hypothetical protein